MSDKCNNILNVSVLFIISLSDYNQTLYEDETTNRMMESERLFGKNSLYCTFDKKFSNWRTNVKYEVPGAHSLHSLLQQSWSVPRETEGSPTDQSLQRLHGLTELWGGSVSKKFNLQIKFILQYCNYNIVFSCCLKFFFNSFGRKSILWALVIENTLPSLLWWN